MATSTPYPNVYQIEEIFHDRDNPNIFNKYLAEPLDAVVVGQDFNLGGHYKTIEAFHEGIYGRITRSLKLETMRLAVVRVIGGGHSPWAAVETLCTATAKSGESYHHEWVDIVRFNSEGKIAQIKEFCDTAHNHSHVENNESKQSEDK